jgi:hypothetical protein
VCAQIPQHPLSDGVGQVGLPHPDQRAERGRRDHEGDQFVQEVQIRAVAHEQCLVEDDLDQERADDAEPAGDDDERRDDDEIPAVGPEEPGDPPQEWPVGQGARHTRAGIGHAGRRPAAAAAAAPAAHECHRVLPSRVDASVDGRQGTSSLVR